MESILEVKNLEISYRTNNGIYKALHDISFDLKPGEIVGIVGESGCGKTTLSSAVLCLLPANGIVDSGEIVFKGEKLLKKTKEEMRQIRGNDISMVFQDPMTSLNPVFTIAQQMIDIQKQHLTKENHVSNQVLLQNAIGILGQVGVPDPAVRINDYPHQFSGGLRQRIMIGMALLSKPSILIADEPTSALDVTMEAQILELIRHLQSSTNTAVLFISHDLGVIAQLCHKVIVMYAGRIVEQNNVFDLYDKPCHPYTQALLNSVPSRLNRNKRLESIPGRVPDLSNLPVGCKLAERCKFAKAVCFESEPDLFQIENDHFVRCFKYSPDSSADDFPDLTKKPINAQITTGANDEMLENGKDTIMSLENLCTDFQSINSLLGMIMKKKVRNIRAVNNINLKIYKGEILGLVGESGCGKTTLGRTILKLIKNSSGEIIFDDMDITDMDENRFRKMRCKLQMIFQDPYSSLSPRIKIDETLQEPYVIHNVPGNERLSSSELLSTVGLSDEQAQKYPHQMSGGQARRVGIARALALHPEMIIADEPTSGLDVSVAASVINLMKDLANQFTLTYIIITHNLNMVSYICDRIAVMYLGNFVELAPAAELFDSPMHPYTLSLMSSISEPNPHLRNKKRRLLLEGEIPSVLNPPPGCRFNPRCRFAAEICREKEPEYIECQKGHFVACHRWEEIRDLEKQNEELKGSMK
ncbi:MAG: dipeptide ABC transporter ATP-binding protein [Flexilinea sp.]